VDAVDIVLVVLAVGAGLLGLRVGALVQVLTFGGFWLGSALGAVLAAVLANTLHSSEVRAVVAIGLVLGLAILGGTAGRVLGGWMNASLRRHHLGPLDSALGVGVAVVAVLLTAWGVAVVLSAPNSRVPWLSSAVQRSNILRTVGSILPPIPSVYAHLQSLLSGSGLPSVFDGLAPPLPAAVPLPSAGEARALAGAAAASTVKIEGLACGEWLEGSGFTVAPGLVATNAHVVAGEPDPEVQVGVSRYHAVPVLYDPEFDLALLRTTAPIGPPLALAPGDVVRGTQGVVLGYPENGPLTAGPAAVAGLLSAQGRDIYGSQVVVRDVYELDAVVRPGNSGGPLVGPGGAVLGMVFSRSTISATVGFALTSTGVQARVDAAAGHTARVSTGSCVNG
jgi:hypothetical protein